MTSNPATFLENKYPLATLLFFILLLTSCNSPEEDQSTTTKDWYKPAVSTTWQWQLQGDVNTTYEVDLYDIDLFDVSATEIANLQAQGKKVICYFSAGSYENWRSDVADFNSEDLGNIMDGWANEQWLDIRSDQVKIIMQARLDLAVTKGCDGVEPDIMQNYTEDTGFALTADDQLTYNKFIATEAHNRGLAVGLKNDLDQVAELVGSFDFSVNEQCHEYGECAKLLPFIDAAKPVFNAEYAQTYVDGSTQLCIDQKAINFRTLVLPLDLDDSLRISCD